MAGYVGRGIEYGNAVADHFTGNGGATYTLNYDTTTNGVVVSLDGVVQKNGTDFNVTGTSLVFTSTVSSPIAIQVIYTGLTLSIGTPGDGTVTNAKVDASAAIASSKISGLGTSATVDTGTSANQIVKLDGSAKIPAVDGSQLTNLPSDITKSTSEPTATTNPSGGVGTLWIRTTTGEMYCCTDATSNNNVWTNIGEGTGNIPSPPSGGTITTDGDYKVHTFTSSGVFEIHSIAKVLNSEVEYLVIAGGGGGGIGRGDVGGGGGGAGGYRTATGFSVSAQAYTVTVGAGGSAGIGPDGSAVDASNGSDSVFSSITSTGGGLGAKSASGSSGVAGGDGGSGGGGATDSTTGNNAGAGGSGNTPSTSPSQGNNGASATAGDPWRSGGGGGASAAGSSDDGGNGTSSSITGSAVTRAGGGGGAYRSGGGNAGTGGGGAGGTSICW